MHRGQFLERTPIGTSIDGRTIKFAHVVIGPLKLEKVDARAVRARRTGEHDVVVPDEQLPFAKRWLIAVHILRVAVSEAVPVADAMFNRKGPQPLFGIDDW